MSGTGMWTKQLTSDGRAYYYNSAQNRSLWAPPNDPSAIIHEAPFLQAPTAEELEAIRNDEANEMYSAQLLRGTFAPANPSQFNEGPLSAAGAPATAQLAAPIAAGFTAAGSAYGVPAVHPTTQVSAGVNLHASPERYLHSMFVYFVS